MKPISRRRLITTGIAATAGLAGVTVAGHSPGVMDWSHPIAAESTVPARH